MPGKLLKKLLSKIKKKPVPRKAPVITKKQKQEYIDKIIDISRDTKIRNYQKGFKLDEMGKKHKDIFYDANKSLNKKFNIKKNGGSVGPNGVL